MNKDPESQLDLLTGMRREDILLHTKEVDYGKFTMTHLKNDDILVNNPVKGIFNFFTNFSNTSEGGEAVSYDIYDVCWDDDDKLGWVKRNYKEVMEKPIKHNRITYNLTNVSSKIYFLERGFLNRTNLINWNELPWNGEK